MPSLVSFLPHLSPGTSWTSDCTRAIGSELEFWNMAAQMAKAVWERLSLKILDRIHATPADTPVIRTKLGVSTDKSDGHT